jgi:hypothetical protein
MTDLLLSAAPPRKGTRVTVSDLKLASDVPEDCHVYVFYVPGITKYDDLKNALIQYGDTAGKNIFVGVWNPSAESYPKILVSFDIGGSPAVVVFGNPKESAAAQLPTAFARIDNPNLLNDLTKASNCINQTCNLFMQGNVKAALSSAKKNQFKASLNHYLGETGSAVLKFLQSVNVTFDLLKGTISFSSSSGKDSKSSSTGSGATSAHN